MNLIPMIQALAMILAVNASPIIAQRLLGDRWNAPMDGGRVLADGERLFGHHKTWRGLASAILTGLLLAPAIGIPPLAGAISGSLAMLGDLISSTVKRRIKRPPGSKVAVLDQSPEALFPALGLTLFTPLTILEALITSVLFVLLGPPVSKVMYLIGIRSQPH